ncbi:GntR family transcriptional regulator [Shouchella shacheensis]|uniref:GntR family transcriptional regulator n=1 Tax=Shouchella shacheensis TaxID=1649580 RepID=UPI0007401C4D|nr:GntR family transcriptional regulator [Shouchella shacheensis]
METSQKEPALHAKIKNEIIDRIRLGDYPVQSQLPTEAEFCDNFNVSRTTVRTALQQLSQEGYVYRRQGRGTFVSEPKVKTSLSQTVSSFNEQVTLQGKQPEIHVVSLDVIPADDMLASTLSCETNAPIQRLVRIRYADGHPLQYEMAYVPWGLAPGLTQEQCEISLYGALRDNFGLNIARTEEHLQLSYTDEHVSIMLQTEENAPCFYLETTAYLESGTVAEYSQTYFHGDRASFSIERLYT